MKETCLNCSNSFSTDDNELVCVLKEVHVIVQEDEHCEDYS